MTRCPRCGHVRGAADGATHPGVCPACGIAYAKWKPPGARKSPGAGRRTRAAAGTGDPIEAVAGLRERLAAQLGELPEGLPDGSLLPRALLCAVLAVWTGWFAYHGIDWEIIGGSLLHHPNLAFHEFGHVFFRPFGEFMAILGGSLFQVLLPFALATFFVVRQRDNLAAAAALWWCGQNFVDLAPYIRDAEYRVLPLVGGGGGEDAHDWGTLLAMLGAVERCHALARASFGLGLLIMVAALAWAAWLLWRAATVSRRP
jgi:hypothetical protein